MSERLAQITGLKDRDSRADLILVNSPINDYSSINRPETEQLPAFGLAHIATECEEAGFNVGLLDVETQAISAKDASTILNEANPKWVGINLLTPTYSLAKKIVMDLNPEISVAAGGAHAKALPQRTLEDEDFRGKIKVIALEDGEYIMRGLLSGVDLKNMGGVAYIDDRTGEYVKKHEDPTKEWVPWELDSLHFANRKFLPGDPFSSQGRMETNIVGSRGCPFACTFCAGARETLIFGIRNRTPMNMVDELTSLREQGVSAVRFIDDLFLANKKRMREFFTAMIESGLSNDFVWDATARVNTLSKMDGEAMELLAKSGAREISVGAESATQRVLDIMDKAISPEMVRETVRKLAEVGVRTKGYFILGTPSETKHEMESTVSFMHELRETARTAVAQNPITPLDHLNKSQFRGSMFEFRPYPGTKLYEQLIGVEPWPEEVWGGKKPARFSEKEIIEGFRPVMMEGLEVRQKHNYTTDLSFTEVPPEEIQDMIANAMLTQRDDSMIHGEYLPDIKAVSSSIPQSREVESR